MYLKFPVRVPIIGLDGIKTLQVSGLWEGLAGHFQVGWLKLTSEKVIAASLSGGRETRVGRKLEGVVVGAPGYLRIFENVPRCEERSQINAKTVTGCGRNREQLKHEKE